VPQLLKEDTTMKRVLRSLLFGLLALLALLAGLFAYFVYTPEPELPALTGTLNKAAIDVAGLKRSYRTYVPKGLPQGAPLVLVVEDEPDIAQLIVLMLNRAGLGAEVAGTALEAVERLQEGGVAAMTLDLLLPDQSGLALMQHIRELPGFRQLPVVVVSAFIEDGRHSLSRELEPIDWIPKPIDEGRLIQALRTGLERLANKSQP